MHPRNCKSHRFFLHVGIRKGFICDKMALPPKIFSLSVDVSSKPSRLVSWDIKKHGFLGIHKLCFHITELSWSHYTSIDYTNTASHLTLT